MSAHRVYFEPSIVAVCSWLRANYEHYQSGNTTKESLWRSFVNEHKWKGFSVNESQCNEFLGYVGEYISKSALLRNVIVDKVKKRYVNLRQKRSAAPEECEVLDTLIRYWLIHAYKESKPDQEIHVINIYADFCSKFHLDSYDRNVKGAIYTAVISNIGDLIENGVFTKVKCIRRTVYGLVKNKNNPERFNNVDIHCSSSGFVRVTWKINFIDMSHELSMARPAGRILFPQASTAQKRRNEEHQGAHMSHSSTTASSSRDRDKGSYEASVSSTMSYLKYLTDARKQEEKTYHHHQQQQQQQQQCAVLLSPSQIKKPKLVPYGDDEPTSHEDSTIDDMLDADLVCKSEPVEVDNSGIPSHLVIKSTMVHAGETSPAVPFNSHSLSSVLLQCQQDIQSQPSSSNQHQVNPETGHWKFFTPLAEFLSTFSQGATSSACLIVTDVMRFVPDWSFDPDACGPIDESCPEAFDLVVFDGCGYIKIVLHTSYNYLVQKHILHSSCCVMISELTLASRDNKPVIVAGFVDVLETSLTVQQLDFIAKVREMPQYKATIVKPALTYREYYVSMWTNEDPLRPAYWRSLCANREIKPCNMKLLSNIAKILEKFDSEHGSETLHCTIAGRISSKSRMFHFAKVVSSMTTSFPFQFYVEIADATAGVFLVFWGLNALQWFDQIEVGDVIAAEGFTVRKVNRNLQQQNQRRFSYKNKGVQELEFSLSYSSPLRKITSASEIEALRLPLVTYTFVSNAELIKSPDGMTFDVFGIIVYTSRVERVKKKVRRPAASNEIQTPDANVCIYCQYRWIGLVDGSSFQPCFLKLYTCCKQEFHHLQPGQLMVCTNVVVKSDATTSRRPRNVHVTSTVESQFYILSDVTSFGGTTVEREPLLYRTLRISQLNEFEPVLLASIVGGYMITPYDFRKHKCDNEEDDNYLKLVEGEELSKICEAMCYQESMRLLVNAEVVRVEFVKASENPTSSLIDITNAEHQNHCAAENTERMEEYAELECVGIEYLDPSVLWEPFNENISNPNHIVPNNNGYWVLSLLTEDLKVTVNVAYLLINKDYWLFPHLKDWESSPFEKLLEMSVCDEEMIKRKLELVSQNLFDRNMSFVLQLYSLGGDNIEIIVQGAELLSN